ncbi:hypothetical protein N665_0037s0020 [Sinapis alba]|nr:hypothetical protein N665_0037s0020 [Sinapis alba]
MGYSSTNIHFDYEGHFSNIIIGGDHLFVVERVDMQEDDHRSFAKRMNMSYISLVVKPKRQSYILDDEDVFVYLTSVDKEQRRSILHVEDIKELEVVPITKQLSRDGKESSYCGNYSEPESEVEEEIRVITEWEDDMGIEMFHEFLSKDVVKDLIDRVSH